MDPGDPSWKEDVGYVGEEQGFYKGLSAAENLRFVARFYARWSDERARRLAERLALPLAKKVRHLSAGNRAKLALVAALAHRPRLESAPRDSPADAGSPPRRAGARGAQSQALRAPAALADLRSAKVLLADPILTIIVTRMSTGRFEVIYAPQLKDHLRAIDRKHHSLIRRKIEEQLFFEPHVETRNRKPLGGGPLLAAEWELRFGPENRFRVFYEVDERHRSVAVLAVGVKDGSRLLIGGREVGG